jgi:hypothetical protein
MRLGFRGTGRCYQPFVHDPEHIEERVSAAGLRRVDEALTPLWLTRIYVRIGSGW